jgi:intein/homing endonuclease
MFNNASVRLLGPQSIQGKKIYITFDRTLSLPGIFEAGSIEETVKPDLEILDSLIRVASAYIEASRERTKARVIHEINGAIAQAKHTGGMSGSDFRDLVNAKLATVWSDVTNNIHTIVDTEIAHAKNVSVLDGVIGVNLNAGVEDPVVYFVVVRDEYLCDECKRLHLMDDGVTPRLWKLSEIAHGYHRKGSDSPSIGGLHPHCFVGTTRLFTDRGLLTVEDLYKQGGAVKVPVDNRIKNRRVGNNQFGNRIPGDVWYHRHSSGTEMFDATPVYDTGIQECLRVSLDSGHTLEVSVGHEFWVDNGVGGAKVRADALKIGDKIPLLSGEGAFGADSFEDEAELMGNLLGDGSLCGNVAQWNFFGNDIEYGFLLKRKASSLSSRMLPEMVVKPPDEKYGVERATFSSAYLGRRFREVYGLDKKPKRVPSKIWGASKSTVSSFLRGLYAADGHSEISPSIVLVQNDREFLQEIQVLLANMGIVARIFKHGEGGAKEIEYHNGDSFIAERKPCWRLCIGGVDAVKKFLREIGLGVATKQARAVSYLQVHAGKKLHGAWRTARVIEIAPIGRHQTYCLTEPMTNTVCANGIVTGQCRCTLVTLLPGYGFTTGGQIKFVKRGYLALDEQRG